MMSYLKTLVYTSQVIEDEIICSKESHVIKPIIIIIYKQLLAQRKPTYMMTNTHRESLSMWKLAFSNMSRYSACIFSQQVNSILHPGATD